MPEENKEKKESLVYFDEEFLEKVKADAAKVREFALDDFTSGDPEKIEQNLFLFATLQVEKYTRYIVEKFEAEIAEKTDSAAPSVFCQKCQVITAIDGSEGYPSCSECGEPICMKCGCTDSHACAEGCDWAAPGLCTRCEDK